MGVMQILPFVSDEIIAKHKLSFKDPIDYNFDPKKSVHLAHLHLKMLTKQLKHPLLIAYGYSNGLGFTKRLLKRGYFKIDALTVPQMLNMELIPNDQARKYGKQVLTNFVIYHTLLVKSLSLKSLLTSIPKEQ